MGIGILKIFSIMAGFAVVAIGFHYAMKRILKIKIKERELTSYYNDIHKYIEKILIVSAALLPLIGSLIKPNWLSKLYNVSFALIILTFAIHIFLEFKYAKDRQVYKLLACDAIFLAILYFSFLYILHNTAFINHFF